MVAHRLYRQIPRFSAILDGKTELLKLISRPNLRNHPRNVFLSQARRLSLATYS